MVRVRHSVRFPPSFRSLDQLRLDLESGPSANDLMAGPYDTQSFKGYSDPNAPAG